MAEGLFRFIGILMLCILISSILIYTKNEAKQNKQSFAVELKSNAGAVINLTDFRRESYSYSYSTTVDRSEPTETKTIYYSIQVNTGPYTVTLPFEIIKNAVFKNRTDVNSYIHVYVTLGNGTVVDGRTWGYFKGVSDLGETGMSHEEIKEITFKQTPVEKYTSKPNGKHAAVLRTIDGGEIQIEGATFIKDKLNRNGCYLGDLYPETFMFESKGAKYEITWAKIKSMNPLNPKIQLGMGYTATPMTLTTKDDNIYQGSILPYMGSVRSIQGSSQLYGSYTLEVEVGLDRPTYIQLDFK